MFPTRLTRGAGVPALERLGYLAEFAVAQLQGTRHIVLVDAKAPASFFAYPGKPSSLVPDDCEVHTLAGGPDDAVDALERLAEAVGAGDTEPLLAAASRPDRPTGPITGATRRRRDRCTPARGRDRRRRGADQRHLGGGRDRRRARATTG